VLFCGAGLHGQVVVGYLQDMICADTLGVPESEAPKFDPEEPFYILGNQEGALRRTNCLVREREGVSDVLGFVTLSILRMLPLSRLQSTERALAGWDSTS
jgi:hypothetical protein